VDGSEAGLRDRPEHEWQTETVEATRQQPPRRHPSRRLGTARRLPHRPHAVM